MIQPNFDALGLKVPRGTRLPHRALLLATAAMALVILRGGRTASAATITVDASKQTAGNPHFWSSTVGTGTAKLALRGDWQTHYKIGNREAGFQRVRGHGLMDNIGMYKGAGSYDFAPLDTYLTAISTANMRPIMELDFFPSNMGTSRAPLSDYTNWNAYVSAVAKHCVDKFGADDVGKWYWEVWNEPDYDGFWTGTDMTKYYTLYDNTVDALTAVIPNVLVGGPATTYAGPISAFLAHVKSANKRITFVSSHCYPGGGADGASADAAKLVSDNNDRVSAITGNGYATSAVKSFNTEWNSSYSGQGNQVGDATASMDNHWNVGFILKAAKLLSDKNSGDTPAIEVFSYWVLTDVFDESSGTDGSYMIGKTYPFGYVFGLITVQGMRKAAFNAFKLLNYLGPKRLQSSGGTGSDGIDAMATTSAAGDSIEILVYNYYAKLNTASGSGDSVTINVSNLPSGLANKDVFVTQFLVDETHSNPYSVWAGQNKPNSPSEAQWQAMRAAQHLALTTKVGNKQTVTTSFSTTFNLVKQAGTLIIVSAKRPLTGRDALVEIEGEDYDGQSSATKEDSGDSTTLGQSISIASGGYVYFENVDYTDDGAGSVQLRVKSGSDVTLELHQDTQTGTLLGSCKVTSTSNAWATQSCTLSQTVAGMSKLYVVPSGAIHLNWLKFVSGGTPPGTGGSGGGSGGTTGSGAGGSSGGTGGSSGSGGRSGGTGGSSGAGGTTARGGNGGNSSGAGGSSSGSGGISSGSGGISGGSGGISGGTGGSSGSGGRSGGTGGSSGGLGGNNGGSGGSSGGIGGSSGGSGGNSAGSGGNSGGSGGSSGGSGGGATTASGCSCRIGNADGPSGTLLIVGLVASLFGLRRRRARRCR